MEINKQLSPEQIECGEAKMISMKLQRNLQKTLDDMDRYIERLKAQKGEAGEREARRSLYKSGIGFRSGKIKKHIVSWE